MAAPHNQAHFASASLYVGDLHKDVTEAMLYEVFNSVGPVASIRVCRDSSSRRSLGYAYVNYHSVTDAERALDTLNYTHIKNVPCRLMWSHRDPSLRKSGTGNIFVKNLDKDIDNKALYDTFSLFGNILSCKVAQDEFGKSRGFGFVHYETEEAGVTAIERVNGMKIGSKTVYVGPFKKKSERVSHMEEKYTNVYVKNIPAEWDENRIKELFSQHGEVTSVALQTDARGRKFGFVNFNDAESAKRAVDSLHQSETGVKSEEKSKDGKTAEGGEKGEDGDGDNKDEENADGEKKEGDGDKKDVKNEAEGEKSEEGGSTTATREGDDLSRLFVARFQPRAERVQLLKSRFDQSAEQRRTKQGVNLYIKNIHDSVDEAGLRELFESFGTITSSKVMTDESGVSRGFGFVSFLYPDEATKAVTEMHLKLVEGKPLYVGLHEKRDERMQRLQQKLRVPQPRVGGGPRINAQGIPPQIQFGAPAPMYFGGQAGGMQQPGGHMPYPAGGNRAVAGGYPGQPGQGMMPWGSRGQPPMRYGPGQQPGIGPQMGMGGFAPVSPTAGHAINPASGGGSPMGMTPMGGPGMNAMQAGPGGMPVAPRGGPGARMVNSQMAPSQQKQMLGERLFPLIASLQPQLAGKITGMMLDMDNSELIMLLESESQLKLKVEEALRVLHQAQTGPGMPQPGSVAPQPASQMQGAGEAIADVDRN